MKKKNRERKIEQELVSLRIFMNKKKLSSRHYVLPFCCRMLIGWYMDGTGSMKKQKM